MNITSYGRNPLVKFSYDETLYLKTIEKYMDDAFRFNFPKMLATLIIEMTERMHRNEGSDVMGEFYEARLSKPGLSQFFTPCPICKFMARSAIGEAEGNFKERPLRVMNPAYGSGKMLMVTEK